MELFVFPPGFGQRSLSPFCVKTMVYLRLAGWEHTVKTGDARRSPTGKLPVLRVDGRLIPDSSRIQRVLVKQLGDPLDGALTPEQHAVGHLVQRTCEEHLYWTSVWLRWSHPEGWSLMQEVVRPLLPSLLAPVILPLARRTPMKQLEAHGLGRHDDGEIIRRGVADLDALETLVGGGPFLFGEAPSSYDVVLYAFVETLRKFPLEHPLTRHARTLTALGRLIEAVDTRLDDVLPDASVAELDTEDA